MNKSEGIHFYVNIKNLDEIIQGEEEANDEVKEAYIACTHFLQELRRQ